MDAATLQAGLGKVLKLLHDVEDLVPDDYDGPLKQVLPVLDMLATQPLVIGLLVGAMGKLPEAGTRSAAHGEVAAAFGQALAGLPQPPAQPQ